MYSHYKNYHGLPFTLDHEGMTVEYGDIEGTVDTLSYGFMIPLTPDPLKSLVTERP